MIKSMTPFLSFNGNCNDALEYYTEIFKAEVSEKMTFREAGETGDDAYLDQIAFSSFKIGEASFYAGDTVNQALPFQAKDQNQISFWLEVSTLDTLKSLEKVLIETGALTVSPIEETFWGAMYFKVKDKFGVNWEFNMQL